MQPKREYQRGSVLVFSSGSYSDYGLVAFLVTIENTDLRALAAEFVREHEIESAAKVAADPESYADGWVPRADPDDFPSWLVAKGHAMPVSFETIHLGDYGDFDLYDATEE